MWDQSNVSYQVEHPNPIIYNNTIVGNKARKGAGIFNFDMNALFFNNIIWNDSENEVGEINMDRMFVPGWGNLNNYGIVQTYFNDVRGGWPGEGNMNADPLLTAESFELNEASPCIGAGVDSVEVAGNWYAAPAMDMKYSPRPNPVDAFVDMGALESGYTNPTLIQVPADQPTIQAAIDAASVGDTVLVAEGTYFENINFRGKAITVASQFLIDGDTSHISKTTIDGSQGPAGNATVVSFDGCIDTTSVLAGFTITGGKGSTKKIGNNNITSAGGISLENAGGKVINNIVRNNEIVAEGQVWAVAAGIGVINSGEEYHSVIRNNMIHDNHTLSESMTSGAGIAVYVSGGTLLIESNEVFGNISESTGNYKALGAGIDIEKDYGTEARIIIRNNHIHQNQVRCQASFGGGMYLVLIPPEGEVDLGSNVPIEIYNNIISENESEDKGGGLAIWNMAPIFGFKQTVPDPIVANNTIVNNRAADGAGIFNYDAQTILLNNILWNDLSQEGCREVFNDDINYGSDWTKNENDGTIAAFYNLIQDGWDGEGNMDTDPLLLADSYELSDSSSCIGAGVDSVQVEGVWYRAPVLDYKGSVRPNPVGSFVDMGALESTLGDPVSVKSLEAPQKFVVYPNPSKDHITLHLNNAGKYEVKLISLSGQVVHAEIFSGNQRQIDLTGLMKGIYLIKVRSDEFSAVQKIIKR